MAIRDSGGISAGDIAKVASAQGSISLDISGDVKQSMLDFISVANRMVSGSKLGQYFDTTEHLAKRLANAVRLCNEDFKQFRGFDSANAKEVVNTFNALTASANGADVSSFFKGIEGGFRGVMSTVEAVQAKIGKFTEGFSEADFSCMFGSFQQIKDWANTLGLGTKEVENLMSSLSQLSGTDVSALTQQLANAQREITSLKEQLSSATSGRMFKELQAEIENLQSSLRRSESMLEELRTKATIEFRDFLSVNMIDPDQTDEWGLTRFQDYFNSIQQGTMTAREAITRFKTEYESLFQNVDSERGLFNVAQVEEFTAKLDQIFVRVEEIGTYIQNTTANAPGMLTNAVERDLQNINKEEQALRHVIDEGGQLGQVGQIVNGVAEASASGTQKMGEMSEQTVKLVDSLSALGSAGEESLTAISAIFRHIGTIKDLDVNTDQFKKLKEALEILQGTTGLEKIGLLSNVNLQGFSNLKISTTIGHLATYLPPLSRDVDISKLQALSQISLSNFSQDNLKVSKASMDHLRELIAQISGKPTQIVNNGQTQQLTEEQTAVERLNTTYREHSEAVAHAIEDEQRKSIVSTELTAKLQSEKEAMDAVSGSAERGASSGQKYSAVWDKMFLGKFVAEFAKVKAQFDALEDKPAKLADNMRKLEAAENDMRAATNMKDRIDAYERFVTILDVVRTQIGAVNAEAKNSNADFKGLLTLLKQSQSAMAGIENSSFTNKLKDMTKKVGNIADESVIRNLKEMRQAYVDMQSAYGTAGPNTEQDYQALINAQIRWKNALAGLNQALATNRTEAAATNAANKESAQTAKQIADGAEQAATQIKNLNAVFESLRDKTKFDTSSFEQMRTLLEQVNNTSLSNDQRQSALQQLNDLIKQNTENLRELSAAEKAEAAAKKQTDNAAKQKATLIKQLNSLLDQCTKAEQRYAIVARAAFAKDSYKGIQDTKASVQQLLQQLNGVDPKFAEIAAGVRNAQTAFSNFNTSLKTSGGLLGNYLTTGFSQLKSRLSYTFGLAAMVYKTVSEIKKMISTAVELDSAMNTLQIVTRASGAEMEEYGKRVSAMAQETAQATKDLIDATTVYARLGYSMDESSILSKYTAMLQGVGDIDASAAQDAMTAIIKAYGKGVDDIEDIMNKMVVVGNNFPISVSQIAEGMNNASSALATADNSFEKSVALLTAANTTVQNVSKASTGLRTIAARIRRTTTGEDDDGEIVEESKYNDMVNALTKHKVALVNVKGEYRDTYDIIKDIAGVWEEMTSMERSAVIEALAGTRQMNVFTSLVTQFQEAEKAMERMNNSAGELQKAYDIRMQSIEAHVQRLKSAYDELAMDFVDSDLAKGAVDLVTKIVNGIDWLVEKIGGLGATLASVGTLTAIKVVTSGSLAAGIGAIGAALGTIGTVLGVIGIGIAGLVGIIKIVEKIRENAELANPTIEGVKSRIEDAQTESKELTAKLEENINRMKELMGLYRDGNFTISDQAELEALKSENEILDLRLQLLRGIEKFERDQLKTAAVNQAKKLLDDNEDNSDSLRSFVKRYNEAKDEYEFAKDQLEQQIKNGDTPSKLDMKWAAALEEDFKTAGKELSDVLGGIPEIIENLDPEEHKDILEELNELVQEVTGSVDTMTKKSRKWESDLKALNKQYGLNIDALRKVARGEEIAVADGEKLRRWMLDCRYTAADLVEMLQYMGDELEELGSEETDLDGQSKLDDQIYKWGTMVDEIEKAREAIERYNKALEGGNNGDIAGQMQDAWQKAMEEIDAGREDSRAAWALYEMVFSPKQIDAMGRDAHTLAQAIQSEFFRGLFDDNNAENGYDDADNPYGFGQRLLHQLEDNLANLDGISVWRDDNGIHYWIDDFAKLADQLGIAEGVLDAFLDDLDAYGSELLTDTKQNTELIESIKRFTREADTAREGVVDFIKASFEKYGDADDTTMLRILDSLHNQGVLNIDPKEYRELLNEAKRQLEEEATKDPTQVSVEPDEEELLNRGADMLNNFQSFLDSNPRRLLVQPVMGDFEYSSDVVDYDTNRGKANSTSSGNSGSGSDSFSGHYSKRSSAGGKKAGRSGGETLVNELGPELISDNGRAFIANGGKPGFVKLSNDAIVFTADETRDIVRGKTGIHAKAHADGSTGRSGLIGRLTRGNVKAMALGSYPDGQHAWQCPNCGRVCGANASYCYGCGWPNVGQSTPQTTTDFYVGDNGSYIVTYGGEEIYSYTPNTYGSPYYDDTYLREMQAAAEAAKREAELQRKRAEIAQRKQEIAEHKALQSANDKTRKVGAKNASYAGSGGGNYVGGADYASAADPQKVDWVAVRINRLQRTIADLEKVASSGFKKLDTRLQAARDQIAKTTDEIEVMERAYDRYIQEANSVGLSESIAANVREGTIDINSYDDDTRKKIDEYTEW